MADIAAITNGSQAVTFMVSAGLVYEIIAAACSSPQTAEINANKRSATLMKWVRIGLAQAGLFVLIAVWLDKDRWPSIVGGALAAALMWWSYQYALRCGLRDGGPSTESY